jgi:DNA polymerase III alpha subunit
MDIDIDLPPKFDVVKIFPTAVPASIIEGGELKRHRVSYYLQNVPLDKVTGVAAVPHDETEQFGCHKIDFLTIKLLKEFKSKEEMYQLQEKEPNWNLFLKKDVVVKLFQLGDHFTILSKVKPRSILEVADVLALIRPNKKALLYKYLKDPNGTRDELFTRGDAKDFRKSHAVAYAILIVLQLHLIEQGRI